MRSLGRRVVHRVLHHSTSLREKKQEEVGLRVEQTQGLCHKRKMAEMGERQAAVVLSDTHDASIV